MAGELASAVRDALRPIPDHPRPGVLFQDITPVLADAQLLRAAVDAMADPFRQSGVTKVAGIEARGFVFGAGVALALGVGFAPLRKTGKLPWRRISERYALEYGTDAIEAHHDAFGGGDRVLVVDDVLATGGTAAAAGRLVTGLGAELVGWSFLLEIPTLGGRARLAGAEIAVLVR
jgi:adenine phosphoribosyltransferase